MLLPIDVIALSVAVGAYLGMPPASRWYGITFVIPMVITFIYSIRAGSGPWWLGPAVTLAAGFLVFTGLRFDSLLRLLLVIGMGAVVGMAMGPALLATEWVQTAVIVQAVLLFAAAMAIGLTSLRDDAWSSRTRQLIGGLATVAGAVFLILGSRG